MESNFELASTIARFTDQEGLNPTRINGLMLYRSDTVQPRTPVIYEPAVCLVAQGRKQIHFGENSRNYDPCNYLINSLTMPIEAEVLDASPEKPYLGLSLAVDRSVVSQLIMDMDRVDVKADHPEVQDIIRATAITDRLQQCFVRLIECLEQPMDRSILGASLQREIFYEVLKGPQGPLLRNCVANHAGANRIAGVVHYIEQHYQKPLDIESISKYAGMSSSSLHEHFKQVTSMSPMQFVKSLRLHRARSLLLNGNQASEASYSVGYSSPSQFSREFKRFFGDTPREVQAAVAR
ncbi:AraC family transcriptional regulator [Motiliproteus sp. MSK22-1]|uniref:AraC family transcriptional regulator n=1 Tax=Motiliproteus sp. MSK22-1 TaxID=1897630 RepID=UPI00097621B2|nr:AraC family transcriptional regulator [Motiliproteus sp. MSK22-1]OMH26580.1 AraC family transcriptional regulator [Motiliproteus sp. MSK22-1]